MPNIPLLSSVCRRRSDIYLHGVEISGLFCQFYVKSILENVEVLKLTFLAILGVLNFVDWVHSEINQN